MRNKLIQIVCLLAFAVISLPGHAATHWLLGISHSPDKTAGYESSSKRLHSHACKHQHHQHHQHQSEPAPSRDTDPDQHSCPICDFYAQPIATLASAPEVSLASVELQQSLSDVVIVQKHSLSNPPVRGPPISATCS